MALCIAVVGIADQTFKIGLGFSIKDVIFALIVVAIATVVWAIGTKIISSFGRV